MKFKLDVVSQRGFFCITVNGTRRLELRNNEKLWTYNFKEPIGKPDCYAIKFKRKTILPRKWGVFIGERGSGKGKFYGIKAYE